MAARNFFGEPNFKEGNGGSGSSSSRKDWISPSEFRRRLERQINAAGSDRTHRVVHHNPMYPDTSANQVQEDRRVQSLYYPSSVPLSFMCATTSGTPLTGQAVKEGMRMGSPCYLSSPLFCSLPRTVERPWIDAHGFLHPPGRRQEDLSLHLMPGSSSYSSSSHTSPLTFSSPSEFYFPQGIKLQMGAGTEDENGCDVELRLSTRWNEGENADRVKRPGFPAKLLPGQEEVGGPKNKKARTDSVGSGSVASGSSSTGEEIDLELRLSL